MTDDGTFFCLPVFRLLSPYLTVLPRTYGVWRSPVARLLWEQEVPGSNPGAPIAFPLLEAPGPLGT